MNSTKRISTDAKLASMINANTDEAETRETIERMEKLAKQRLRRACLYGGGARYENTFMSPFVFFLLILHIYI